MGGVDVNVNVGAASSTRGTPSRKPSHQGNNSNNKNKNRRSGGEEVLEDIASPLDLIAALTNPVLWEEIFSVP